MYCIGTYHTSGGTAMLYQMDYLSPNWVTNICYLIPGGGLYSPTMVNIVKYGRDHDGRVRNSVYWQGYVRSAHDSFVLF